MKNLSIILAFVLILSLLPSAAFPLSYQFDFDGDEGWDTEWTLEPPPIGEIVPLKIWLDGYTCPPDDKLFGVEWYFKIDDPAKLQLNMANSFANDTNHGGPFDPSFTVLNDQGGGVYALTVAHFTFVTVSGNKILLFTLELECIAPGSVGITAAVNVGAPFSDGFASDCNLTDIFPADAIATIFQPECDVDADCDDGNVCTADSCNLLTKLCENNPVLNGTPCDDGIYCNGAETCEVGVCESSTPPCATDGNPCTDDCDEATDTCYVCNATSFSDPCCSDPACISEAICTIVITDYYVDGTTGDNTNDGLTPATAWKTITHALNQVPTLITLNENNRAIIHVAGSTYDTVMGGGDAETFPLDMVDYVSLEGAGHEVTIIDAEQTETVIQCNQVNELTIEGFTLTGGRGIRGGVECRYSSPTINNCNITGNEAFVNGGGIWCKQSFPDITNCIISLNTAAQNGGGIACGDQSSPSITSCTIVDNTAGDGFQEGGGALYCGNGSSPMVTDCILWDNYPDEVFTKGGSDPSLNYCCIKGGWVGSGADNTDADPKFFELGNYHLMYGSSCLDSGTSVNTPTTDIDGNARYDDCATPNTGIVIPNDFYDRGAREYQGDSDLDGILDDGDGSCIVGDNPCMGGAPPPACDDNCTFIPNPGQEDVGDGDGVGDACDNCPASPNGPLLGTCVRLFSGLAVTTNNICNDDGDCTMENSFCMKNQSDSNENGIGDVCECYSDLDNDSDVDLSDLVMLRNEFGRIDCDLTPCQADINGDDKVDLADLVVMKIEFGKVDCTTLP